MDQRKGSLLQNRHRDTFFFHRVIRMGKNRKPFVVTKFRTMKRNAIQNEKEVYAQGAAIDRPSTAEKDPRVTWFGRLLRKTHLDELPQLIALVTGKLNLVGIRPLQIREYQALPNNIKRIYRKMGPGLAAIAYACQPFPPTTNQLHAEYLRFYKLWKRNRTKAYTVYAWKIFWNKIRGKAAAR
ncbi:MAG: sugar transferase [Candidatus Iainarchaeum archaeon]|uniref:Sugar transferase n=1 Tax=Candidatus Iainarchaeum sp. TaxID=3101447 RepID=A0A7T9I269_9ARCH|nr:MAG: sugar transferase [Candidatus Diapherotrites archaeon]